jgi:kumamolisin
MPRSPRTPSNNDIPEDYLPIEGSERFHRVDTRRVGEASAEDILQLILILRPRLDTPPLPDLEEWEKTPLRLRSASSRPDRFDDYGASPEDADKVAAFARQNGLEVLSVSLPRRMIEASGTIAQIDHAFGIKLGIFERPTETYRGHDGAIHLPRGLVDLIQAVFGLDNRRMAYRAGGSSVKISPLTPPDVAKLYGFPSVPAGIVDQTIGIFEFGGGYVTDASGDATDADGFFAGLNPPLPKPKMFTPPVSILGRTNSPGTSVHPSRAYSEVVLDIDCAGSIAVGARWPCILRHGMS